MHVKDIAERANVNSEKLGRPFYSLCYQRPLLKVAISAIVKISRYTPRLQGGSS